MNRNKVPAPLPSPTASDTFDTFFSPPPFQLPESIRKALRDLIELHDIEWSQHHPRCIQRREDFVDTRDATEGSVFCFSDVDAHKTIANLEEALSIYLNLQSDEPPERSLRSAVDNCLQLLSNQNRALATILDRGWEHLFTSRDAFSASLTALSHLKEMLLHLEEQPEETPPPRHPEQPLSIRQRQLIWLLADILRRGGLSCYLVFTEEKLILSPGMEILILCLPLAGIDATPETVEQTLMSLN